MEILKKCAFCDHQFDLEQGGRQVQTDVHKTDKVSFDKLMVWQCQDCKTAGKTVTKFGAEIFVSGGTMAPLEDDYVEHEAKMKTKEVVK